MARNNDTATSVRVNSIVEGTSIRGEVRAPGNFRIDGTVTGDVAIEGRLIIGSKGKVEGNVTCKDADIEGYFNGDIKVGGLLALKSSARIEGDAIFQRLMVEEGATLKCTCNINTGAANTSSKVTSEKAVQLESMQAL